MTSAKNKTGTANCGADFAGNQISVLTLLYFVLVWITLLLAAF